MHFTPEDLNAFAQVLFAAAALIATFRKSPDGGKDD